MSNDNTTIPTAPTSASAWKQSSSVGAPLRVPSGNTCLVKPMGMQALVRKNLIPNELLNIITTAMKKKEAPKPDKIMEEMTAEKLIELMDTIDLVVCEIVVDPPVNPVPPDGQPRNAELLYVDEVSEEDKIFIWQYAVGGTRDLESFRGGFEEYVGNVAEEQNVANEPLPAPTTG